MDCRDCLTRHPHSPHVFRNFCGLGKTGRYLASFRDLAVTVGVKLGRQVCQPKPRAFADVVVGNSAEADQCSSCRLPFLCTLDLRLLFLVHRNASEGAPLTFPLSNVPKKSHVFGSVCTGFEPVITE